MTEPIKILVNWDRIRPAYHPIIEAVDPRVQVLWGGELDRSSPAYQQMLAEAEILFGVYSPRGLEHQAPRLRWMQNIGAGVEWYWHSDFAKKGIVVTTASGVGGHSIAEYVLMGILMLIKKVPERLAAQREHQWRRVQFGELRGKTVLVIGLGGIGSAVARLAKAFETTVIVTRRNWQAPKPEFVDAVHPPEALHTLLPQADVVVITAAYTPETRHLIGEAELACMKPTAILVNVARGSLLDQAAATRALQAQRIGGAVLDVFDPEPLPPDDPLWDLPNVLISAHNTVANEVYDLNLTQFFAEQLRRYLNGEPLINVVDPARGY